MGATFDLKAACDNLASFFAPGTLATPSGATPIRGAFGQAQQGAPALPMLFIEPHDGTVIIPGNSPMESHHLVDVHLLFSNAPGDIARVETDRQLWLATLLHAVDGHTAINSTLLGVKSAIPTGYAFDEIGYSGDLYPEIVIHWDIWVQEYPVFTA